RLGKVEQSRAGNVLEAELFPDGLIRLFLHCSYSFFVLKESKGYIPPTGSFLTYNLPYLFSSAPQFYFDYYNLSVMFENYS
ncbi:MAG: hypothetical protein IJL59_01140, partial [Clostridia bacterium]|nr:hypothetical protein [Clostridia bacterium]